MNAKLLVSPATMLLVLAAGQASAAPSGAIFTTTIDGGVVNGNTKYENACDVYLDGGPGINAPQEAAGLPDGDYYFQVTDPSGKTLLSTDPVRNRCVTVFGGVIIGNCATGTHTLGNDVDHPPAMTVQLCPYTQTPNNGGVYKAWMVPVGDGTIAGGGFVGNPANVDNNCGPGCFHGFLPARSKTDNFKVKVKKETPTFCIAVHKDKIFSDGSIRPLAGLPISITDSLGVTNTGHFTDSAGNLLVCELTAGAYIVEESTTTPSGVQMCVVNASVNGISQGAVTSVGLTGGKNSTVTQSVRFLNAVAGSANCPAQ